jgi:hypothetical protein
MGESAEVHVPTSQHTTTAWIQLPTAAVTVTSTSMRNRARCRRVHAESIEGPVDGSWRSIELARGREDDVVAAGRFAARASSGTGSDAPECRDVNDRFKQAPHRLPRQESSEQAKSYAGWAERDPSEAERRI